ncbi:FAD-dependent oxidoreductase [Salinigranum sp. GCM10025319]|uniref:FAD-dependent oxidoreductase n=1 Tax=Salinigranum sp. GCM10025319 TaxID=3252687 RepID=UPI003618D140
MDPIVIVGGDAAGMSAASKFKRERPERDVVVFEKGEYVSYAACGMPYYVKGDVESLDDLLTVSPEEFVEERGVDLRLHHEVVDVDPEAREVTVEGPDGRFTQPYDQVLIATGAHAVVPPFEGMDLEGVFTMHSLPEAEAVRDYLTAEAPEAVAVVGGGYVGIEMAEAFAAHEVEVHLFEMLPHVLAPFGETVAEAVEDHLREQGIHLHLDTAVERFVGDTRVTGVDVGDEVSDVDLALVGVGVAPNTELAEAAGVELGETGAIATDAYGRTSRAKVFAAGDCAEARHVVTGDPDHVPLALTANRAGRAIGQTMAGEETPVGDIAGTAVVKAFDLTAARTGVIDEDRAREAGFDPVSVTITAASRAHYYPGAEELTITLLGDRDSERVLGAAMVGREGVAKRIDTVAVALHEGATAHDLSYYDLAYAPPYSPVWDSVLTAAKVLDGKLG